MADSTLFDTLTPAARAAAAPYWPTIQAAALKHGVDPSFALGLAMRESGFRPDVVAGQTLGDDGQSKGMWQVQTKYMKDWGFDPKNDLRGDYAAATDIIMPHIKKTYAAAKGDPALASAIYMRGAQSPAVRRIVAGVDPSQAFAGDVVGLNQYTRFSKLRDQGVFSGGRAAPKVAAVPQSAPMFTEPKAQVRADAAQLTQLGKENPRDVAVSELPLMASNAETLFGIAPAQQQDRYAAYHAAQRDAQVARSKIHEAYKQLGIDPSWTQNL